MSAKSAPTVQAFADVPAPDLSAIPVERLEQMHDAAATVLQCERVLAKSGMSVVSEVLRGQGDFVILDHYPRGDIHDSETHSQYFYHSHTPDEMLAGENGHFHLFVRPGAVAPDIEPWLLPGAIVPEDASARFAHIGAISVDAHGRALRLFTTNQWVTNETLYRADDVIRLIDYFSIELAHPNWAVSQWLNAMVTLYRPQLEVLLRQRDIVLENWRSEKSGCAVLADRELQNTSALEIEISGQVNAIEAILFTD